jgi:hypothetical protein
MKFFDLQFNGLGAKALYFDQETGLGDCKVETYTNGRNLSECYHDSMPGKFVQYTWAQSTRCSSGQTYNSAKSCLKYGTGK